MKKILNILVVLAVLITFLPGCHGRLRADPDKLYVNITWHQHQPLYYTDEDGVYTRPWVRAHATKDYYDMAYLVSQYPDIHLTINLTPVLIRQIDDFVENGAKDYYWVLAEKPASDLTDEEKRFILTRFFDANWDNIIARFPRYQELLNLRGGTDTAAIEAAMAAFSEQDIRDLQIWFNLAWFDPMFLEQEPLLALVEKGENFSEEDKVIVFDHVREVMSEIIPLHKEMQEDGQIEVITTPYAHPILPLIFNTELALVGNPTAEMPERFSWPNDAISHVQRSVEIYQEHFGSEPQGMWPGEGSVAEEVIPMIADAGYQFVETGEPVLAQSLGIGEFTRDANETVQQADDLYRPYYVDAGDDRQVAIFFRDWRLSDKLGFEYSNMSGEAAAQDLMQRLDNIRTRLEEEGAEGPHIVSIVLDGENAWEYYENDGKAFLNAMYRMLSESETVQTVTPSQYLELFPEQRTLDTLFPGAWFSANYDTWIGEAEEKTAWNYLGETRAELAKYDLLHQKEIDAESLALAQDYMYLAEGSDWFWWYGSDQDSGVDEYFDTGFRALLKKVYETLGETPPDFLDVPIIPSQPVEAVQPLQELGTPLVDGRADEGEWDAAAIYASDEGEQVENLAVLIDKTNLYLRLEPPGTAAQDGIIGFYLRTPTGGDGYPFARGGSEDSRIQFGFSATHLFEWDGSALTMYLPTAAGGWDAGSAVGEAAAGEGMLEALIPLNVLGELQTGDDLRMAAVLQPEGNVFPAEGPAQFLMPDLGLATLLFEVIDPEGDDNGPGTYTYPTDTVFSEQVFDIKTFSVLTDGHNLIFTIEFYGAIPNSWGSTVNLSLQTMDVYIDQDPGAGTGARLLLDGRNAALSEGNGWEYAIFAEGWYPDIYAPDPDTLEPKSTNTDYRIIVDAARQKVTLRVPLEVFGEGDPMSWGYAAVVLSQDGFPATGVLRVRDVQQNAEQWRLGGAPDDNNHTRIIDMAWPQDGAVTQAEMLSSYPSSSDPVSNLSEDDFAQMELYLP